MTERIVGKPSLAIRAISVVAGAALAFSLGAMAPMTAMAADDPTYSVTVTDPQGTNVDAHQYKIYQIVTGTVGAASSAGAAATDSGGHHFIENSLENPKWGSSTPTSIGTAGSALSTTEYATFYQAVQSMITSLDSGSGEHNSKNEAVENFLNTYVDTAKPADTKTSSGGQAKFEGLQPGYYLVTDGDTSGADYNASTVHILKVVGSNVTVSAKSALPTLAKTVLEGNAEGAVADACFGEAVTYKLTFTLPSNVAEYQNYVVSISDQMSTGLVFDEVTTAVLDTTDIKADITKPQAGATGDISFGYTIANPTAAMAGKQIVITYKAHMNAQATLATAGNPNTATATYSNNPYGEGTGATKPVVAKVHAFGLDVTKYDDANNPLSGVTFELFKSGQTSGIAFVSEGSGTYHVATAEEIADGNTTTVTSLANGTDGKLHLKGLDSGTYTLKETHAPDGYDIEDPETTVVIAAEFSGTDQTTSSLTATVNDNTHASVDSSYEQTAATNGVVGVKVTNPKQLDMPITGEQGLMIVTIVGVALVAVSGGSMLRNRRRDSDEA